MILPTIHTNGTSPEMLKEGYLEAYRAVTAADATLVAIEFNARDYYPQGPEAWTTARAERQHQLARLRCIAAELMTVLEHIQEALDAKAAQRRASGQGA